MFLNIHIYFIILKTYDKQFTLTTKTKSLHIIFKTHTFSLRALLIWDEKYTDISDVFVNDLNDWSKAVAAEHRRVPLRRTC